MTGGTALEEAGALIAGRYRVEQTLGKGGMAAVYRVLDERTGTRVALKRSWAREAKRLPRHAALLEREYHTLAELAHPHIIEVFDYGVDATGPYYTMELLEGEDLGNVERLEWKDTCAILRDIASSLAILHSRGLIHRDVSMRNVHRGKDGGAKLFDFGAMTSMGVTKDLVGTPPFLAPEVLQLQALDARVDLFSLGAIGYRLLTGRHAFPARRIPELRDLWRSKPQPPAVVVPGIPVELSKLILRMLTLDRAGRPPHAAEVIEKLNAIAELPRENIAEISRAYLTTPILVGREAALLAVRRRLLSLMRGDGGVLRVSGRSGSGRSRLLDACALEAKLLGVGLVRADARDARNGDWGVTKAIATQLFELYPGPALEAARVTRNVLAHVVHELEDELRTSTAYAPERSVLLRELRDWMLSFTKKQRVMIVVDDADQIDEPSAALLSAIANKAERNSLMIAVALEQGSELSAGPSLRLLYDIATPIELEDLLPQDTEALVRSLFGDAPNLASCATRLHGLSNGNPRTTMELAQHLISTGRAQYEGGSWALPAGLDDADLPHTLTASLATRLDHLSDNALELARALALADGAGLQLTAYPALTVQNDTKCTFRALDELVAARILNADRDQYSFVQRGFLAVLRDSMSDAQRVHTHARIARQLEQLPDADPLRRAEHLFAAGDDLRAIDLLCALDLGMHVPSVALLAAAVERGERLGLPAVTLHRLRMALIVNAPSARASEAFQRFVPVVLRQLEQDSGLARYRELAHVPAGERLAQALALTQQAHLATPEHERVHGVIEAIRELARLMAAISAMAIAAFDLEVIESLPMLEPLFPLSPTLPVIAQIVDAGRHWICGRVRRAELIYEGVIARISEPDRAGFDDAQHLRVRLGVGYSLGLLDARWGADAAEEWATLMEERSEFRVNAWRIRAVMNVARGNALEARKCSRRAELLEAQHGASERYGDSTVGVMLVAAARLGDLLSVKALLPRLHARAAEAAGWQAPYLLGRAYFCSLQGDLQNALSHAEHALEVGPAGRNPFFGIVAGEHVSLLKRLGRMDEALELSRNYVRLCDEQELEATTLYGEAALILSDCGEHAEAQQVIGRLFVQAEVAKARGFMLGAIYERAAEIAIGMHDADDFKSHLASCAAEFELSKNPALGTALAQLIELAREHGVYPPDANAALPVSIQPVASDTEVETIHSRLIECIDSSDRARCALTLLLQATSSCGGYLYGTGSDQTLQLIAALPDAPADPGVALWAQQRALSWATPDDPEGATVSASLDADAAATEEATHDAIVDPESLNYVDDEGRIYSAIALFDAHAATRVLAAVFVPEIRAGETVFLPRALTATIARELIEYRDASGWSAG